MFGFRQFSGFLLFWITSATDLFCQIENRQLDHERDLVLHYGFDDLNDDRIANLIRAKHVGVSNQATFYKEKKSGNSLVVKKNQEKSGYVETKDHPDFHQKNFTVAAWIKLEQNKSNGSIVCKHDWHSGGARGFVLRCYSGNQLNFTVGAGGWRAAVGKTTLPALQWIHVAGSFDGKNITVYVNGRRDGAKEIDADYDFSTGPLRIGHAAYALDTHRKFDGKIDEVMFWKRALADREVLAVFNSQKNSRPPPLLAADISDLIRQLGSKSFRQRKSAQKQLIDLRSEALPLLKKHLQNDDFEIAVRVKQVKQAIIRNIWNNGS